MRNESMWKVGDVRDIQFLLFWHEFIAYVIMLYYHLLLALKFLNGRL